MPAHLPAFFSFVASLILATLAVAQTPFSLYASGEITTPIRHLSAVDNICPSDFTDGFTIACDGPPGNSRAIFRVNNRWKKTEKTAPYFIAGDAKGVASAWSDFPSEGAIVQCKLDGSSHSITLTFDCPPSTESVTPSPSQMASPSAMPLPSSSPSMSAEPSTMSSPSMSISPSVSPLSDFAMADPSTIFLTVAGRTPNQFFKLTSNKMVCPFDVLSSDIFTIACRTHDEAIRSVMWIDGKKVRSVGKKNAPLPLYAENSDFAGMPYAWTPPAGVLQGSMNITVKCRTFLKKETDGRRRYTKTASNVSLACSSPSPTPSMSFGPPSSSPSVTPVSVSTSPSPMPSSSPSSSPETGDYPLTDAQRRRGCVVFWANSTTELSDGWVAQPEGLEFRPGNTAHSIVPRGKFPLMYSFSALNTSRYGVVIDMTTKHKSEFNDIWMEMPGVGFLLTRNDTGTRDATGWIKGYHNFDKRAAFISSVDHKPHTISTGEILQAGEKYVFGISGRSNQVTIHRVIMFPCMEGECVRGYKWKQSLKMCSKLQ